MTSGPKGGTIWPLVLNLASSLKPVWAIVAYFGSQEPPFWTTVGPLGGHSAQYLARAVAQRGHLGCPGVSLGAQSGQSAVGFAYFGSCASLRGHLLDHMGPS